MRTIRVFIFANCQGRGVKIFLSPLLQDDALVEFLHIENYGTLNDVDIIYKNRDFISNADIYIYQPLKSVEGDGGVRYASPLVIDELLPRHCERISFP